MTATLPNPTATASPEPNGRAVLARRAAETARVLKTELAARIAGEVRFDRES